MDALLSARGIRLIVASPPNSATIYSDKIKAWPREGTGRTEYDLSTALLSKQGISALDLRPVLREARAKGDTYLRHDTHWNAQGAIAAFNAISAKAGLVSWAIDPEKATAPESQKIGGDLANMLGISTYLSERDRALNLGPFAETEYATGNLESRVYELKPEKASGPAVLIIGDSFTAHLFPPMIAANGGRAFWIHHKLCQFDWAWLEKFKPDQVWYMPTERYMPCDLRRRPIGMPTRGATASDAPTVPARL